ncbi:MAG: DNA-binding protein [Candidatus Hodarchaeota archaeon]
MDENSKDEHELEKIRLRKMKALMQAQKQQQETKEQIMSLSEKINFILRAVLNPDAYSYLDNIRMKEPNVYRAIYNELVSPEVIRDIDYLIAIISKQGGVPRRIPLDVIIYLERKVKGIKGTVKVKRGNGDMMDLGSYLTK